MPPPATKQEAVSQIAALMGVPDMQCSPGSTEPKTCLTIVATGFGLPIDIRLTKPELAEAIAKHAGVPWGADCDSRQSPSGGGSTVTLTGLLRVLDAIGVFQQRAAAVNPTSLQPSLHRASMLTRFPWAGQQGQKMIVGTDLDATLSSVLAHHLWGWEIIGFYDLNKIYTNATKAEYMNAVWLDLDIAHPSVKSIGHHILQLDYGLLPAHAQSLNPNMQRGVTIRHFGRKYPLSTFHLLCWLWNYDPPVINPQALPLYWLPDSSYINGQSDGRYANGSVNRHYRTNVLDWVSNVVPVPAMQSTINEIETLAFEQSVQTLFPLFQASGWPLERGTAFSNHLGMTGGQCRFSNLNSTTLVQLPARLTALYQAIIGITGWKAPVCPANMQIVPGRRVNSDQTIISPKTNGGLSAFLQQNNVFSYALHNSREINYTIF